MGFKSHGTCNVTSHMITVYLFNHKSLNNPNIHHNPNQADQSMYLL